MDIFIRAGRRLSKFGWCFYYCYILLYRCNDAIGFSSCFWLWMECLSFWGPFPVLPTASQGLLDFIMNSRGRKLIENQSHKTNHLNLAVAYLPFSLVLLLSLDLCDMYVKCQTLQYRVWGFMSLLFFLVYLEEPRRKKPHEKKRPRISHNSREHGGGT